VQKLKKDDVKAEALTPKLNKRQWLMNEVAFYGMDTGDISKGRISSLKRKLDSLSSKKSQRNQMVKSLIASAKNSTRRPAISGAIS